MNNTNIANTKTSRRIQFMDTVRGILIILVVLFHFLYDLDIIFGVNTGLFSQSWFYTFRDCFVGLLIFISGISCNLSRNNIKRGIKTFCLGLIISLVTAIFMPSEQIIFGILHFFGVSMILYGVFQNFFKKIPRTIGIISSTLLYILTLNLYNFSFSGLNIFAKYLLFIIGFDTGCSSADYYPLLPWIFIFIGGTFAGKNIKTRILPDFFYKNICPPLTFMGQHTLIIYILHQPIIYGALYILFTFL